MTTDVATAWTSVIGQPAAVATLRRAAASPVHAYLLVGPTGSTKVEAARTFAAALLAGATDPDADVRRRVIERLHPDVHEVERVGAAINRDQAGEIIRQATLSPNEGARKVLILHEFHLLDADAAARLLKTIEEPPPSTHFVIVADFVPVELVTIASRCARVDFVPISAAAIAAELERTGVDAARAAEVADAAGGDLDRARLLSADEHFVERRDAFAAVAQQLDGNGTTAVTTAKRLLELIETAAEPLAERHRQELADLAEREERFGTRGSGRAALEARQRREVRRHRVDELRAGLATMAASYRDRLAGDPAADPQPAIAAVAAIHAAIEALEFNPNETLLLTNLLWSLPVG